MPRRCLDCSALIPTGSRCERCALTWNRARRQRWGTDADRAREARRPSAAARGYDAQHRRDRAALLASRPPCHWCGAPGATIADHVGDRAARTYVASCTTCNARRIRRPPQREA